MSESPSTTSFVKRSEEYQAPERPFDRLRAITAKLPRVDANGRDLPRGEADPTVTETVTAPHVAPPTAVEPPPAEPAQGMTPVPSQGVGGVPVPAPTPGGGSTLDRIRDELTRKLAPATPEGYRPAPPR